MSGIENHPKLHFESKTKKINTSKAEAADIVELTRRRAKMAAILTVI
jgi:hypothetical protein